MNIKELKEEEESLVNLLTANRDKQRKINIAAFVAKYGANIGDTVEYTQGKTLRGVVSNIKCIGVTANYYLVKLLNSNGKMGKIEKTIWYSSLPSLKIINKANETP